MKQLPDWDTEPFAAWRLLMAYQTLGLLALFGSRWARLRVWRLAREYGIRRQYLRKRAWQRRVNGA